MIWQEILTIEYMHEIFRDRFHVAIHTIDNKNHEIFWIYNYNNESIA